MKKSLYRSSLLLAGILLSATSAVAVTVLEETFPAGQRTTQSLPQTSAWWTSRPEANLSYSTGSLGITTGTTAGFLITYFTDSEALSLNVGDSLSVAFTFQLVDAANAASGMRVGLFDSGGSRISADGLGGGSSGSTTGNQVYLGYTGYMAAFNPAAASGLPMSLRKRSSGVDGQLITSLNAYGAPMGGTGGTANTLANATTYTGNYSFIRSAENVMSIQLSITGGDLEGFEILREDSLAIYTSFDTLAFSANSNTVASFSLSSVTVTYTPIPEPGTAGLLGAGVLLGLVALNRKRRQSASRAG